MRQLFLLFFLWLCIFRMRCVYWGIPRKSYQNWQKCYSAVKNENRKKQQIFHFSKAFRESLGGSGDVIDPLFLHKKQQSHVNTHSFCGRHSNCSHKEITHWETTHMYGWGGRGGRKSLKMRSHTTKRGKTESIFFLLSSFYLFYSISVFR